MPTSFWTLIRDKNDRSILGTEEIQFEVMIYVFFSNYSKEGLHYVISCTIVILFESIFGIQDNYSMY